MDPARPSRHQQGGSPRDQQGHPDHRRGRVPRREEQDRLGPGGRAPANLRGEGLLLDFFSSYVLLAAFRLASLRPSSLFLLLYQYWLCKPRILAYQSVGSIRGRKRIRPEYAASKAMIPWARTTWMALLGVSGVLFISSYLHIFFGGFWLYRNGVECSNRMVLVTNLMCFFHPFVHSFRSLILFIQVKLPTSYGTNNTFKAHSSHHAYHPPIRPACLQPKPALQNPPGLPLPP